MANIYSEFFQGQTHRSLLYWPNHSEKLGCPKTKSLKILLSEHRVYNSGSDVRGGWILDQYQENYFVSSKTC